MKNLKKVLSVIITLAMLLSVMPIAMAEEATSAYTDELADYLYGWKESYDQGTRTDSVFMCVTDKKAKTGTHSMLFVNPVSDKAEAINISQSGLSVTSGEYTLSFWITGDRFANWRTMVSLTGGQPSQCNLDTSANAKAPAQKVGTDGEWSKYEYTFDVPEGKTNAALSFIREGNTTGLYVDDISLKDANGTELLKNGSFEDDGKLHWTDENSDYFYGWTESYEGRDTTDEAVINKDAFMCVTDLKAKEGNYSMLIYDDVVSPSKSLQIIQSGLNTPAGTYSLSMWLAGTYTGWRTMVKLGDSAHQVNAEPNGGLIKGETVGEWTKYTATFTLTEGVANNKLYIMRQGYSSGSTYLGTFIDNVSLKDAKGNELLKNGGFENDGKLHWTDENSDYFYGWTEAYEGRDTTDEAVINKDAFMCVTDLKAKDGNYSMLIYDNVVSPSKSLQIIQSGINTPAGTYTFSMWLAGTYTGWRTMVKLGDSAHQVSAENGLVKGETVGEWTKYTATFTLTEGVTNNKLYIMRQGYSSGSTYLGTFIDNVSLKDANGNELLANGSFESDGKAEYTEEFEEYFCGWARDWADATSDEENIYMNVTDKRSKSGKYSMLIKNNAKENQKPTAIVQKGLYLGAGTYTLSLWLSGSYSGWRTMFKLTGADGLGYNMENVSDATVTTALKGETCKGFTNYIFTYTVSEGKTATQLLIQRQGGSDGMFIDDVSLTDVNGNELLTNGGFEMKGDLDACINPVAYPTSEGNAFTLTWKNPAKAYDAINIYYDGELQTGVETETISTAANASNEFYYSGVENYTEHTVVLEALRGGEVVYSCELPVWTEDLGMTTTYAGNQPIAPWKYTRMENTQYGYANTAASVDYSEKASGSSSMKLTGNLEKVKNQCYPNINQTVTLDLGVKYVLSFKAKLNNVGSLFVVLQTSDLGENIWGRANLVSSFATSDWKTYTVPLVFENENGDTTFDSMNEGEMYSANIMIAVERMLGSINIDDVKIYAVEEDDETYAPITPDQNLIENGGFEFGGYAVEDAKFEVSNGSKYVKIDKIQSGNIRVTTAIRNISMGENFGACTIIAVYNNGQLVSIPYTLERTYSQSSVYLPTDKYSATVSIPEMTEGDNYEIKVMYWDGISSMKPLDTADCLN